MDCAKARLLVSRSLDGELVPGTAEDAALQSHLVSCAACRALDADFAADQELLTDLWPPVSAPPGFAERVVAALPKRRRRRRSLAIAAAFLLVLLAGGILSQGPARASIGLFLRQVVLRESPTSTETSRILPMTQSSLDEAQQLVPWRIRQPTDLPAGYRLVDVYAGAIHSFSVGPTVVLHYRAGDGPTAKSLGIMELQAAAKQQATEPVAPGAVRQVRVGESVGLLIDGRWGERDGRQVWERGTMLRLIVEDGDLVFQLQADPRDGWDAERLIRVAVTLL
jgi:hypothetical protein